MMFRLLPKTIKLRNKHRSQTKINSVFIEDDAYIWIARNVSQNISNYTCVTVNYFN